MDLVPELLDQLVVHVERYRGLKEKTLSFDTKGLIKINGNNGSGKTTFLNALSWCLYGVPSETHDYTEARTKRSSACVTVTIPGAMTLSGRRMRITRKSRPNLLSCQYLNFCNSVHVVEHETGVGKLNPVSESKEALKLRMECVQDESQSTSSKDLEVMQQGPTCRLELRSTRKRARSAGIAANPPQVQEHTPAKQRCLSVDVKANQAVLDQELGTKLIWQSFKFSSHGKHKSFLYLAPSAKLDVLLAICNGECGERGEDVNQLEMAAEEDKCTTRSQLAECKARTQELSALSKSIKDTYSSGNPQLDVNEAMGVLKEEGALRKVYSKLQDSMKCSSLQEERLEQARRTELKRTQLQENLEESQKITRDLENSIASLLAAGSQHIGEQVPYALKLSLLKSDSRMLSQVRKVYAQLWLNALMARTAMDRNRLTEVHSYIEKAKNLNESTHPKACAKCTAVNATNIKSKLQAVLARQRLLHCIDQEALLRGLLDCVHQMEDANQSINEAKSALSSMHTKLLEMKQCTQAVESVHRDLANKIALHMPILETHNVAISHIENKLIKGNQSKLEHCTRIDRLQRELDANNQALVELEKSMLEDAARVIWHRSSPPCPCCRSPTGLAADMTLTHRSRESELDATPAESLVDEPVLKEDAVVKARLKVCNVCQELQTERGLLVSLTDQMEVCSKQMSKAKSNLERMEKLVQQTEQERNRARNRALQAKQAEVDFAGQKLARQSCLITTLEERAEGLASECCYLCRKCSAVNVSNSKFSGSRKDVYCMLENIASAMTDLVESRHALPPQTTSDECDCDCVETLSCLRTMEKWFDLPCCLTDLEHCSLCLREVPLGYTSESDEPLFNETEYSQECLSISRGMVKSCKPDVMYGGLLPHLLQLVVSRAELESRLFLANSSTQYRQKEIEHLEEDGIGSTVATLEQELQTLKAHTEQSNQAYRALTQLSQAVHVDDLTTKHMVRQQELEKDMCTTSELLRLMKQAKHKALEELVENINSEVARLLENQLGNNLSVQLSLARNLVSKSKHSSLISKLEVVIRILKNGEDVGSLDTLSGGEEEKVNLMFSLCMSSMLHSPIMILDETLSTLDSDSMDSMVDILKTQFKGLVIMVNHRHGDGWYDECLHITKDTTL